MSRYQANHMLENASRIQLIAAIMDNIAIASSDTGELAGSGRTHPGRPDQPVDFSSSPWRLSASITMIVNATPKTIMHQFMKPWNVTAL